MGYQHKVLMHRFIIILDPGISNQQPEGAYPSFDRGMEQDVWIKEADGVTDYEGEVWPGDDDVIYTAHVTDRAK